jgi:hypothetical protein
MSPIFACSYDINAWGRTVAEGDVRRLLVSKLEPARFGQLLPLGHPALGPERLRLRRKVARVAVHCRAVSSRVQHGKRRAHTGPRRDLDSRADRDDVPRNQLRAAVRGRNALGARRDRRLEAICLVAGQYRSACG